MKLIIILTMLLSYSVSAKYIMLPKVTAVIENSTELEMTLELYKIKYYNPMFGLGHGASETILI